MTTKVKKHTISEKTDIMYRVSSFNALLGSPRQLICQCCGIPLDDTVTSKEPDGSFNEEYCKWCCDIESGIMLIRGFFV